MNFEQKLKKKTRGKAFIYSFQDLAWANRYEGLKEAGFINSEILELSEVNIGDAEALLMDVLSTDLCYGCKVMSKDAAAELAKEFIASQDKQARFFTNSNVPYSSSARAWAFTGITEATIDTGLMVKVGKQLVSMLWVVSFD